MSDFMNVRPVEAELFHAHRQTDERTNVTELIVAFRNFANARKNKVCLLTVEWGSE